MSAHQTTRRVQQANRGRGRGSNRFYNNDNKRKRRQPHPDSYTITLLDGKTINMHASYSISPQLWRKIPKNEQDKINSARQDYKRKRAMSTIAQIDARNYFQHHYASNMPPIASSPHTSFIGAIGSTPMGPSIPLPPPPSGSNAIVPYSPPPPPPPPPRISEVNADSGGSGNRLTIMGGRNERTLNSGRHNQGSRE